MAKTTLVQITFKVNAEDYKDYEMCYDDFVNGFNHIDLDTVETELDE